MKKKTKKENQIKKPKKKITLKKIVLILIPVFIIFSFLISPEKSKIVFEYITNSTKRIYTYFNINSSKKNRVINSKKNIITQTTKSNFDNLFKTAKKSSILRKSSNIKNLEARDNELNILVFICYQRIVWNSANNQNKNLCIKKKQLISDLKTLVKKKFVTVTLSQWQNHIFNNTPLPKRCAVICFEGSFLEHYTIALPILNSLKQRATFFLKPDFQNHGLIKKMTPQMIKKISNQNMEIGISLNDFKKSNIIEGVKGVTPSIFFLEYKKSMESIINKKIDFALTFSEIESDNLILQKIVDACFIGKISLKKSMNVKNQKMIKKMILTND